MKRLRLNAVPDLPRSEVVGMTDSLKLLHINISSISNKWKYIEKDELLQQMDVICFF